MLISHCIRQSRIQVKMMSLHFILVRDDWSVTCIKWLFAARYCGWLEMTVGIMMIGNIPYEKWRHTWSCDCAECHKTCNSVLLIGLGLDSLCESSQVRLNKEFGVLSGLDWLELIVMIKTNGSCHRIRGIHWTKSYKPQRRIK